MAGIEKVERAEAQTQGNKAPAGPKKVFVDSSNSPDEVVRLDSEGAEILFLHGEGRFLKLEDGLVRGLSKANRTSYSLSADLDAHSGGIGDDIAGKLAVGEQRDRRARFERERVATPREMEATRKLQVLGPNRSHVRAVRPDRLGYYEENGYSLIKADDPEFAVPGAAVVENHYELKDPQGRTDLLFVAISQEDRAAHKALKQAKADRLLEAAEAGRRELDRMSASAGGGKAFTKEKDSLSWQDR